MNFFAELSNAIILSVEGRDAERYLNNRLSNNIKSLSPENGSGFAAALSPQGKTEAFFCVYRRSAESFILLCDGGQKADIISAFSRYKVADKFNIDDLSEQSKSFHLWSADAESPISDFIAAAKTEFGSNVLVTGRNRFGIKGSDILFLSASVDIKSRLRQSGFTETGSEQSKFLRLKAGIPEFPTELGPDFLIQESGLSGSVSTSKGCYVGQEVTQKIDSFAQLPFNLSAFKANSIIAEKTIVFADPGLSLKMGEILSSASQPETSECFGIARIKSMYLQESSKPVAYVGGNIIQLFPVCDFSS